MERKEREIDEIGDGDIEEHDVVLTTDEELRVVSSVKVQPAGKTGSKRIILSYVDGDEETLKPGDGPIVVLKPESESEPMIKVGEDPEFDPRAVRVSPRSKVVWFWTGDGGEHRVVGDGFESETVEEQGYTFEETFEATGAYTFRCGVHGAEGIVVVD